MCVRVFVHVYTSFYCVGGSVYFVVHVGVCVGANLWVCMCIRACVGVFFSPHTLVKQMTLLGL